MKLKDLYDSIPPAEHGQVLLSGDRVYYDGEEFIVGGDGELHLVHSHKALQERLDQIAAELGIT